jgi:hypothetical protein
LASEVFGARRAGMGDKHLSGTMLGFASKFLPGYGQQE